MYTYKLRRDFATRWVSIDPVLAQGEPGFEIDTGKLKIGDGVKTWLALPYLSGTASGVSSVQGYEGVVILGKGDLGLSNVDNTADVVKPISVEQQVVLDMKADLIGGKVPTAQIPAVATGETITVADQVAMLALTGAQVQPGDIAIRSDQSGRRWILAVADPSLLSSWIALEVPDSVSSVQGQQGAVILGKADIGLNNVDNISDANKPISTAQQTALDLKLSGDHVSVTNARAPTAHGHPQADVTGLDTTLTTKADLVGGVVPTAQIPAIATGQTVTVTNQAAMLALTASQVQAGDVAIRSDQSGRRWLLAAADPSLIGSWIALEVPDAVSSVNSQQGAVILGKADIGLNNVDNISDANKPISTAQQTALDAKQTTAAKNVAGGYAGLNAGGKLASSQIPALEPVREIGAAGEPAFQNSWTNFGGVYEIAGFYIDVEGIVRIQGVVVNGIDKTVFTLPVGYRPAKDLIFPVVSEDVFGQIRISTTGEIGRYTGMGWISICGISFRAA
jgi:hypothetical protein